MYPAGIVLEEFLIGSTGTNAALAGCLIKLELDIKNG
jgi:hypothetical protein